MKFILLLLLCISSSFNLSSQTPSNVEEEIHSRLIDLHQVKNNDENFEGFERLKQELEGVEIIMLGEQSHRDGTTLKTKIKLIKYLHQELGFEILAFESNIYECDKAWSMIQEGHDVNLALGKGLFSIWSILEEMTPLYTYVSQQLDNETSLMIAGFDPQFIGNIADDSFSEDLTSYLSDIVDTMNYEADIQQLQLLLIDLVNSKRVKKKNAIKSSAFIEHLIEVINSKRDDEISSFWVQTLKTLVVFISDNKLGTDQRDRQMADNLIWLKNKYPEKKSSAGALRVIFFTTRRLSAWWTKKYRSDMVIIISITP